MLTYSWVVEIVVKQRARFVAVEHLISFGYHPIYLCGVMCLTLVRVLTQRKLTVSLKCTTW